ncbi:MAG: hypothetical protein AAF602_30920 [Myxococcota bacterium]
MALVWLIACGFELPWIWPVAVDTGSFATDGDPTPETDVDGGPEPDTGSALPPNIDLGPFDPDQVDLLFVIDHSCSMSGFEGTVDDSWSALAPHLAPWDWHIGAVTMDLVLASRAGVLVEVEGRPFLDATTSDPESRFQELVDRGSAGAIATEGMGAVYTALRLKGLENQGFRRNAALHLVFVSDVDDQTDPDLVTMAQFESWLDGFDGPVTIHALISGTNGQGEPGVTYESLATRYGGVVFDIEDETQYDAFLDLVGATLP